MSLLWTECLCPLQIHVLKPSSPLSCCLEMGPWERTRSWGWRHHDRISVPRHEKRWERACFLALGEGTIRRQSAKKEAGSHQTPDLPVPWSPTSQPPELIERNVCLSHSVHGIFALAAWTKAATHLLETLHWLPLPPESGTGSLAWRTCPEILCLQTFRWVTPNPLFPNAHCYFHISHLPRSPV